MYFGENGSRKKDLEDGLLIDMTTIAEGYGIAVPTAHTVDVWGEWENLRPTLANREHFQTQLSIAFTQAMQSFGTLPSGVEINSFDFLTRTIDGSPFSVKALIDFDEEGFKCLTFMLPDQPLYA